MVSTLECDARMPRFKPWPRHYNFPKFLYFSSCFDTFDFKYIFFLSIYFSCFNIYKNKTISIVYCEAFGVKCSEYFFEPSPNELAALLEIRVRNNPSPVSRFSFYVSLNFNFILLRNIQENVLRLEIFAFFKKQ